MNSLQATQEVLNEDPRTRDPFYDWLFVFRVLKKMGFNVYIGFDEKMPSPETLFRNRRKILNEGNKFNESADLGEGVTIVSDGKKL